MSAAPQTDPTPDDERLEWFRNGAAFAAIYIGVTGEVPDAKVVETTFRDMQE